MVVVPMEELSDEVLAALVEEFVTRSGAIHGEDVALDVKSRQVRQMLKAGKAVIVWDEQNETATILTKEELKKWDEGERQVVEDEGYRPTDEG